MTDQLARDVARLREEVDRLRADHDRTPRMRRSPATAIAVLALAIAIGGGSAFAVATIGTSDIADGAVTRPKIANDAVGASKIAAAAVGASELASAAVRGDELHDHVVRRRHLAGEVGGSLAGGRIPSGRTVTGVLFVDLEPSGAVSDYRWTIDLPGRAGKRLADADVNFAPDSSAATAEEETDCTGSTTAPTAPAGMACLYLIGTGSGTSGLRAEGFGDIGNSTRSFVVRWGDTGVGNDVTVYASWAYTAP